MNGEVYWSMPSGRTGFYRFRRLVNPSFFRYLSIGTILPIRGTLMKDAILLMLLSKQLFWLYWIIFSFIWFLKDFRFRQTVFILMAVDLLFSPPIFFGHIKVVGDPSQCTIRPKKNDIVVIFSRSSHTPSDKHSSKAGSSASTWSSRARSGSLWCRLRRDSKRPGLL